MENFDRHDFKHYLVKRLIIRFDYDMLMYEDLEKILKVVRTSFVRKGFDLLFQKRKNVEYTIDAKEDSLKSTKSETKVYSFRKDNVVININNDDVDIAVDTSKNFSGSDCYLEYIDKIWEAFKKLNADNVIANIKRLGIRKTNILFLKEMSKLNEYFSCKLFNQQSILSKYADNNSLLLSNSLITYTINNDKINLVTNIEKGKTRKDQTAYRVVLDIDSYNNHEGEGVDLPKTFKRLNDNTFRIYEKSLTNNFKERLVKKVFEEDDCLVGGVNKIEGF